MEKENVCVMNVEFNTIIKTEWITDKDVGLFTLKLDYNPYVFKFHFLP